MPDTNTIDATRATSAPPASPRRFLWRGGAAVALFVLTAALCLLFLTPGYDACRRHFGRDFLAFYAAGTLAREGRTQDLYDLDTIGHIERRIASAAGIDLGDAVGPWWNPPVYAWLFAPLSALSFNHALVVWTAVNVAAACAAAWLLGRVVAPVGGADRTLLALLLLASAPFLQSITHGQNSAISLLIVAIAVTAWRRGADFAAGVCVGLLGYKPQLAAALGVVLVLHRGRRAFAGIALVGGVVLLLTVVAMPGALADYFRRLPQNLHVIQVESTYLWERHVTLKAFWRLLIQGRGPSETLPAVHVLTILSAAPLLAGLAVAAFRARSMAVMEAVASGGSQPSSRGSLGDRGISGSSDASLQPEIPRSPSTPSTVDCRIPFLSPLPGTPGGGSGWGAVRECRMMNDECRIRSGGRRTSSGLLSCILHSSFCIPERPPTPALPPEYRGEGVGNPTHDDGQSTRLPRDDAAREPTTPLAGALIAATLAAAPLLMPFYFDYDLLLLAVAGAIAPAPCRRTLALWSALYLWLFVNPYLAAAMRLNLTVPLLYGLAASLVLTAIRRESAKASGPLPLPTPALAKAA